MTASPKNVKKSLTQLKNRIDNAKEPFCTVDNCEAQDAHFLRFLKQKGYDHKAAYKKLERYHKWVDSGVLDKLTPEELIPQLKTQKLLLMGKDLEGRPILLIRSALHIPGDFTTESTMLLMVATVFTMIAQMDDGVEQATIVWDLKGWSLKNRDPDLVKAGAELMSQYFPQRIYKVLIVNAPFIVCGLWRALKPMLPTRYSCLVSFLAKPKEIRKYVAAKECPKQYGGKLVLDTEDWLNATIEAVTSHKDPMPHLYKFCKMFKGDPVSPDEVEELENQAEQTSKVCDDIFQD